MIKAITLWEPWASLIGRGKMIETRSWPTNHRGWIAIAAASRVMPRLYVGAPHEFALQYLLRSVKWVTYGHVISVAHLTDCKKIVSPDVTPGTGFMVPPPEPEFYLGDYTPGRYGWIFDKVIHFTTPVPAKGRQQLWNWKPPEGLLEDLNVTPEHHEVQR